MQIKCDMINQDTNEKQVIDVDDKMSADNVEQHSQDAINKQNVNSENQQAPLISEKPTEPTIEDFDREDLTDAMIALLTPVNKRSSNQKRLVLFSKVILPATKGEKAIIAQQQQLLAPKNVVGDS